MSLYLLVGSQHSRCKFVSRLTDASCGSLSHDVSDSVQGQVRNFAPRLCPPSNMDTIGFQRLCKLDCGAPAYGKTSYDRFPIFWY